MTNRPLAQFFYGITLVLLQSCGLSSEAELPPPNIVWITSEDNSVHYLNLYNENGIETPNIAKLAEHGALFDHAFSNAPVCSVARSTLITGCYAPRMLANFHRKIALAPMPEGLQMFPSYLRQAGYYTTNNSKEDYNLIKSNHVWDESSKSATWRNRKEGQPFFHVQNIMVSHEYNLHFTEKDMMTKPTKTKGDSTMVLPVHPQTEVFRYTNALYRDKIQAMDSIVGDIVDQLAEDGLLENTFIFYFGDHGGVLPGSKGYVYETGLQIPLVLRIPDQYKERTGLTMGGSVDEFVSFVDFGPTVLDLAGIQVPKTMDGEPFLNQSGTGQRAEENDETYSYADRFDEKYDMVRAVRKGDFKYIRNYQPFNFDGLMNNYRYIQLAYQEWKELFDKGELNEVQAAFFNPRAPEALYDLASDPFETNNLADEPEFEAKLTEMRQKLGDWMTGMPDLSFYPEFYLLENALENPVMFGQQNKTALEGYRNLADMSLQPFESVNTKLIDKLDSDDPWERYWALIVCSSFREEALEFREPIREMAQSDSEMINRVRAAEYLGMVKVQDPVEVMTQSLYASRKPAESLLILNCITLMQDGYGYQFSLDTSKVNGKVADDDEVNRRLEYLTGRDG